MNRSFAREFLDKVNEIESKNENDFALKHFQLTNEFLAKYPSITINDLIMGLEEIQNRNLTRGNL